MNIVTGWLLACFWLRKNMNQALLLSTLLLSHKKCNRDGFFPLKRFHLHPRFVISGVCKTEQQPKTHENPLYGQKYSATPLSHRIQVCLRCIEHLAAQVPSANTRETTWTTHRRNGGAEEERTIKQATGKTRGWALGRDINISTQTMQREVLRDAFTQPEQLQADPTRSPKCRGRGVSRHFKGCRGPLREAVLQTRKEIIECWRQSSKEEPTPYGRPPGMRIGTPIGSSEARTWRDHKRNAPKSRWKPFGKSWTNVVSVPVGAVIRILLSLYQVYP